MCHTCGFLLPRLATAVGELEPTQVFATAAGELSSNVTAAAGYSLPGLSESDLVLCLRFDYDRQTYNRTWSRLYHHFGCQAGFHSTFTRLPQRRVGPVSTYMIFRLGGRSPVQELARRCARHTADGVDLDDETVASLFDHRLRANGGAGSKDADQASENALDASAELSPLDEGDEPQFALDGIEEPLTP